MNPRVHVKASWSKVWCLIILLIFFTSCGSGSASSGNGQSTATLGSVGSMVSPTPSPTSTPTPSPTPSPTSTPTPSPTPTSTPTPKINLTSFLHSAPVFADISGLHLQSKEGLQCPLNPGPKLGPSAALVFSTPRLSYSAGEIQQMRNYLQEIFADQASLTTSYLTSPPSTLQWVPGSTGCDLNLQVSNVGSTTVQIKSIGVQLTSAPQFNTYVYHVIDACSLAREWCGGVSGGSDCSVYKAFVKLNPQAALDTNFTALPIAGDGVMNCPEATLHPGDTLYFRLYLSSAPYIYSVLPLIKVSDANGSTHTFTLKSMAATLAFADIGASSCYGLQSGQNTTFTIAPSNDLSKAYEGCLY